MDCIHSGIEAQAERTPGAVAADFAGAQLTYAELNRRANQVAHRLRALGVGPEARVGLCLERSVEMLVGWLGILKAGGAYVPLDPSHPPERLAFALNDAGARVLLTQQALAGKFSESQRCSAPQSGAVRMTALQSSENGTRQQLLCLDSDWEALAACPAENPANETTPANLAYVIFTSGSTGKPKGVAIEHRSVLNLAHGLYQAIYAYFPKAMPQASRAGIEPAVGPTALPLRVSLNGPLAFDTSVKQLIQLLYGHALVIVPEEIRFDGEALLAFLRRQRVEVFDCTPSQLRLLLAAGLLAEPFPAKLHVLVGGEPIDAATWRTLAQSPDIRFYNVYGPTECTVDATVCQITAQDARPTVGRPIANTQAYVLDANLQPVAGGAVGELHLGGIGLARGYLNRPDLTAEKFIPHPFDAAAGARLYKTGDLARWLADGNLELLGRLDTQVKIRGSRVELGEIEAALRQHPEVRDAAVVLGREGERENGRMGERGSGRVGEQRDDFCSGFSAERLTAYVVPAPERAPEMTGRRRYKLPNNLGVVHLNKNETDFQYRDLFENRAYLRHGVTISDGDCVFDVGANIGLFTLLAHLSGRRVQVFAFEPNPAAFEVLRLNAACYGVNARLFPCGLSQASGSAAFTHYPKFSSLSGLYAEAEKDKELVRSYLRRQQNGKVTVQATVRTLRDLSKFIVNKSIIPAQKRPDGELLHGKANGRARDLMDELLAERFASETFPVRLRTLSEMMQENAISRIDLLKINAEKSEHQVLAGIDSADWKKIRQIVMELHDVDGRRDRVTALLAEQGYDVAVEEDWSLEKDQNIFYVYATRNGKRAAAAENRFALPALKAPFLTGEELRGFLQEKLPAYMLPSAFVMLETLPLTPNGKVDRQALLTLANKTNDSAGDFAGPRNPVEETLAQIWSEVLGVQRPGIHDNFFDLGGHSLSAALVLSRLRQIFKIDFPFRRFFEAPTIAGLSASLEAIRQSVSSVPAPPILPVARDKTPPLSFSQQQLWLFHQLHPDSLAYNEPLALRLTGSLTAQALEQSLGELQRRHEILRTTFAHVDGQPVQVISPPAPLRLSVCDLSEIAEAEREKEWARQVAEEVQQPFNLASGPLWRTALWRLAGAEHILLLTMHHLVVDDWSANVLCRELAALYTAFVNGQPSPLSEPAIQYADFAHWQRQWLQGDLLEAQLAYWRQQLDGLPPLLQLPADRPRPAVQSYRGGRHTFVLPAELSEALRALSRREGVTLFITLLAAFKALLARYTGQEDLAVGTATANRNHPSLEGMIGFFVNTLVLCTSFSGDPTFQELLGRVRETALGAFSHQDLPFEKLVEALQPERRSSHHPLFQVMFTLQSEPLPVQTFAGLAASPVEVDPATAKFDLTLNLCDRPEGIRGWFEYNTDLFEPATIARLTQHFQILLAGIAENPAQRVSRLPLLTAEERRAWSGERRAEGVERRAWSGERGIHHLFEEQVERSPEAVAVVFDDQQLSYRELNRRANRLAHHLQKLGVGTETLVGVCMERSAEMIVAILAILKAGGAYVPLDPAYPQQRLAFMLEDAKVRIVLTQHRSADCQSAENHRMLNSPAQWLCLDEIRKSLASENEQNPANGATADHLAYVIYTSGSTGKPKGVGVPHRAVIRLVRRTNYIEIQPDDVLAQASNSSFDAATFEIWGALLNGAKLVGMSKDVALSPRQFAAQLRAQGITVMFLTTALFNQFAGAMPQAFSSLRCLLFGGEAVEPNWVNAVLEHGPPRRLLHVYGPTENTTFSSWHLVQDVAPGAGTIPIGRPISNTKIYLLDRHLQPVPIGVAGELYLGGEGLAREYLNRPALTAEKFVPNPFSEEPGARLYKTGDQARYLNDGNIEFLGRFDDQVKIRGFRVEPGEIEAALRQHPAVREAVVVAESEGQRAEGEERRARSEERKEKGEERETRVGVQSLPDLDSCYQLVAYIAPRPGQRPVASELRGFVKEKLPEYMVPAAFVLVDKLPLNSNGKVDRQALPAPDSTSYAQNKTFAAARDDLERQLKEIWERVLGIQPIGVTDNFFELGGHSLLAVRLFAQIEKAFGKNLPISALLQAPTIAQLAAAFRDAGESPRWSALVPIQPHGSKPPFFCMHAGGGTVLFYRDLAQHLGLDQPFYGLQFIGHNRVESMATHYINELRTVQPHGPYALGGASFGGTVAFEMARQLRDQGEPVALVALFDTCGPDYPQYLPTTSPLRRKVDRLIGIYFHHHLANLLVMESADRKLYVAEKWDKAKDRSRTQFRRWKKTMTRKLYRIFDQPVPPALQAGQNPLREAILHYVPQAYPGKVTLFRGSRQPAGIYPDPTMGWRNLAASLEIYEVPGFHNLTIEPRVRDLVKVLKPFLERAQAETT